MSKSIKIIFLSLPLKIINKGKTLRTSNCNNTKKILLFKIKNYIIPKRKEVTMNELEIKEKIYKIFPIEILNIPFIQEIINNFTIEKLPIEITTGNHEVYKINNYQSKISELGLLFLFPGSGIKEHLHPKEKGISEIYTSIGENKITWQEKKYNIQECKLGKTHGVDIDNTPRIIYYNKTNELLLKKTNQKQKKLTP